MYRVEVTARPRREDGSYWAEVTELPGAFASADTLDELVGALAEAVALYLGSMEPRSVGLSELKVAVTA
jgi:predicted RNase H-like HicB family nuclease